MATLPTLRNFILSCCVVGRVLVRGIFVNVADRVRKFGDKNFGGLWVCHWGKRVHVLNHVTTLARNRRCASPPADVPRNAQPRKSRTGTRRAFAVHDSTTEMAAPTYIISRVADPIFAVFIGVSAAVTRINREEKSKGKTTSETIESGIRYGGSPCLTEIWTPIAADMLF